MTDSKKQFRSLKKKLSILLGEAVTLCKEFEEKAQLPMQMVNEQIGAAYKSLLISEEILFPAEEIKKKKPEFKKYGEYGWVKLTDAQYEALKSKYTKELLERAIRYLDESAQKTGNKNGWKDWSLVIHNCIREDWGKIVSQPKKQPPKPPEEQHDEIDLIGAFMNS